MSLILICKMGLKYCGPHFGVGGVSYVKYRKHENGAWHIVGIKYV